MVTVIMISGEKITGVLVQDTPKYLYVESEVHFNEFDRELFSKDFCDNTKTLINKLPKDEIKLIIRGDK